MNQDQLFQSHHDPIPRLRRDLQIIPVKQNGDSYLYFHDQREYATPDLALKRDVGQLLSLFDGQRSINDLESHLEEGISKKELLEFVQFLDKHRLLASSYFNAHAQQVEQKYEQSTVHQSVTAGDSYPSNPDELKQYLDNAFAKVKQENSANLTHAKALYAPHIDPRVALDSYVKAFTPIRDLTPKRVVILATSHYAGLYPDTYKNHPFVLVNKDFELPLGSIRRDKQAITELMEADHKIGITHQDRAHRMEHSIELHLLFLSYLWNHRYEIVPFIVRGLDDLFYMEEGHLGTQLHNFSNLLRNRFGNDDETFFLISGDLAHFGKKFGDDFEAATKFEEVESFDRQFLEAGSQNQQQAMLELIKENMDPFRICGFPPLYTFLQTMPDVKGEILSYDLWDERERDSAVSFGSILYRNSINRD